MTTELSRNYSRIWPSAVFDGGSATNPALDQAFSFEVSGKCVACQFVAPVSSTTVNLWVYCTSETGNPSNVNFELRNNDTTTAGKPEVGGAVIGTPGADVSFNNAGSTWVQFSQYSVTLTQGVPYWLIIHNKTATPGSNYPAIRSRAAMDGFSQAGLATFFIRTGRPTDGMVAAMTAEAGMPPFIIKFSTGDYLGLPYSTAMPAFASNTNWRGNRITLTQDAWCDGILAVLTGDTANWKTGIYRIYQGATQIVTGTIGLTAADTTLLPMHFSRVKLYAGIAYDVVFQPAAASTDNPAYDMGLGSIPADVTAAGIYGVSYVSGATPGSFTVNSNAIFRCGLILDSAPIDRYPRSRMVNNT